MNLKDQHIEFLLEEPSMENFLRIVLPQILPDGYFLDINCFLRPHQGKTDLKKSIPKKVKTFSNFHKPSKIIIIHDRDSNDCKILKSELIEICAKAGNCPILVRISCRELENWYLGDMESIEMVYPTFKAEKHIGKAKFRDVDNCQGSYELSQIIRDFQKGFASKNIPQYMNIEVNSSTSFNHLVTGVKKFLGK